MMLKKWVDNTFIKFLSVGVINTLIGTAVMFGFYNILHFNYWVSSASNYIVGGVVSYFLNKNFTFKSKSGGWRTALKFAVNVAVCYGIAYGIAKPLLRMLLSGCSVEIQDNVAMVVGMGLYVLLNYLGQRFLIFGNDDQKPQVPADDERSEE